MVNTMPIQKENRDLKKAMTSIFFSYLSLNLNQKDSPD